MASETAETVVVDGNLTGELATMAGALDGFLAHYPDFDHAAVETLRATDYARLDRLDQVYLDYTGGGLHAHSQIVQHVEMLENSVLGNPHSHNPTSLAMTERVEQTRAEVLRYFHADPAEYVAIFTANASGALKHVGESYPFTPESRFLLTFDNHNSVNGIREFARSRGAQTTYVPLTLPELRLDIDQLRRAFVAEKPQGHHLFAMPAQSNFSGVQHPLGLIAEAKANGWDVLIDAAAFAPTNRLDIGRWQPDFVSLSFYKMFGFPTGVGALIARRSMLRTLRRPWFAGGTITIASVQGDGHYFADDEAAFEDGTIDYLNIPAVEIGLRHLEQIGIDTIHTRVACLTGWLLDTLPTLRHSNGTPLIQVYGPTDTTDRGGTVTISFYDVDGVPIDERRIEELAGQAHISLRTGCFCNPGAGEIAHGLSAAEMQSFFQRGQRFSFEDLRHRIQDEYQKSVASIRVSVGIATTFADVYRLVKFAAGFQDRTVAEIGQLAWSPECDLSRANV